MAKRFDAAEFANHLNHHSGEYREHSWEAFRHMREQCPVAHSDQLGGFWVLTRYEDVMNVARDDRTFTSVDGITINSTGIEERPEDLKARPMNIPIDMDPPLSRQYRKLLDPLVTPARIEEYERYLRGLATELIDGFIETGQADLSLDLGSPLTSMFTMKLTGLPIDDWRIYAEPIQRSIGGVGDPAETHRLRLAAHERMREHIERQRTNPVAGGAIEHLWKASLDGRPLESWEVEGMIWLFIVGGVDTTQAGMGNGFVFLSRHPERKQELIDHPERIPDAVEEFLRYFTPQQGLCRRATRDVELGGQHIRAGDFLLMSWAAANRDPAEFPDPEEVDFRREENRHMAFGIGAHRCMGSNIGRAEIRICLEEVLKRLPDYEVEEAGLELAPDVGTVYAYKSLPIRFTPGKRVA
jgi:cytochrome P450